jgi:UDP-N-acetylglucosamine 2-epimerase (non-hydrolysing)
MKLAIILGTRPEIIKLSPVIRAARSLRTPFFILHTNQHYSAFMDAVFFRELELPKPRYNLDVESADHGEQTGKMLAGIERVLKKERPDVVLVQGDTNTVLAGALAAAKLQIKVGHVEAGLRSYDRTMPEEINRIIADHVADFLFVPTRQSYRIARREGIEQRKIFLTGNTIVDAVRQNMVLAGRKSVILTKFGLRPRSYALMTLHRPANVDDKSVLSQILRGVGEAAKVIGGPIVFPAHPRTVKQLSSFRLRLPDGITMIEPIGYLDFLALEEKAKIIMTDSGGMQEEACILRVPCVTIRDNTERPETITVGANVLAGRTAQGIIRAARAMSHRRRRWRNPFGDGTAGRQILAILGKAL